MEDAPKSGRPFSSVTQENIAAVSGMDKADRHIRHRYMKERLHIISAPAIHTIVHAHRQVRDVFPCFTCIDGRPDGTTRSVKT